MWNENFCCIEFRASRGLPTFHDDVNLAETLSRTGYMKLGVLPLSKETEREGRNDGERGRRGRGAPGGGKRDAISMRQRRLSLVPLDVHPPLQESAGSVIRSKYRNLGVDAVCEDHPKSCWRRSSSLRHRGNRSHAVTVRCVENIVFLLVDVPSVH